MNAIRAGGLIFIEKPCNRHSQTKEKNEISQVTLVALFERSGENFDLRLIISNNLQFV
jgi:hypothetical protein